MTRRAVPAALFVAALTVACAASPAPPAPSSVGSTGTLRASPMAALEAPAAPEQIAVSPVARPPQPTMHAALRVELVADPCVDRDVLAPPADDAVLTLLDRTYAISSSYVPADLVPVSEAGFGGASATKLIRAVVLDDLAALRRAVEDEGLELIIDSAYRSYAAQEATFGAWTAQVGAEAAALRVARPGHSEHQLGTAIDASSAGWSGRFGDWALESPEGAWMAEHAWEYGFVMSFPAGAQDETCFGYEPWHYRWIGRELAAQHRADGRPLRTFLAELAGG